MISWIYSLQHFDRLGHSVRRPLEASSWARSFIVALRLSWMAPCSKTHTGPSKSSFSRGGTTQSKEMCCVSLSVRILGQRNSLKTADSRGVSRGKQQETRLFQGRFKEISRQAADACRI